MNPFVVILTLLLRFVPYSRIECPQNGSYKIYLYLHIFAPENKVQSVLLHRRDTYGFQCICMVCVFGYDDNVDDDEGSNNNKSDKVDTFMIIEYSDHVGWKRVQIIFKAIE